MTSTKSGKAAVLPAAAAYTLGAKRSPLKTDATPGPGEYFNTEYPQNKTGTGFRSSARDPLKGNGVPGPGDYNPDPHKVLRSSAAYTMVGAKPPSWPAGHSTPSPGDYTPERSERFSRPVSPSYSIGARVHVTRETTLQPSAAEYNPIKVTRRSPSASIKFRHNLSASNSVPGPGQYNVRDGLPRTRRPSFTFGTRDLSTSSPRSETPGPGAYDPDITVIKQQKQRWSVPNSARCRSVDLGVPGPGTYHHDKYPHITDMPPDSETQRPRACTIATRVSLQSECGRTPGPGDYNADNPARKSAPAYTFRIVHAKGYKPENNPGPGQYDVDKPLCEIKPQSPKISMSGRLSQPTPTETVPGPGEYNPPLATSSIAASIKFKHQPANFSEQVPGPGAYRADQSIDALDGKLRKAKGLTMGMKLPDTMPMENTPGPGHYNVEFGTIGIASL